MPLTRSDKIQLSEDYSKYIDDSSGFVIFQYHGLTVEQISELRHKVREAGGFMKVVKNRMLKIAVNDKPYSEFQKILTGPNAVVFAGKDPVTPTKALVDFAKDHEVIKIVGGVVSDTIMDADQVEVLAKTPPLDQLYAKILGGIKAPASNILGDIKGLSNKIHGLIKAYAEKLEKAA